MAYTVRIPTRESEAQQEIMKPQKYIVRKYIFATSMNEALEMEKTHAPDECELALSPEPAQLTDAIGFKDI